MRARWTQSQAARRGTDLHAWAHEAIRLGQRMKENSTTMNMYINDGIRYRMKTDFVLFVSEDAFGEADCLSYNEMERVLRINDLKTGISKASMKQLEIYAGYFCLEYELDPEDMTIILRLYQSDKIIGGPADPAVIRKRMNRTLEAIEQVKRYRKESE